MENVPPTSSQSSSHSSNSFAWTLVIVLTILLIVAAVIIVSLLSENISNSISNTQSVTLATNTTSAPPMPSPTTIIPPNIINLNKTFTFPIYVNSGVKAGEISFTIKKVERTKEVMIGANKGTAVPGRELVILDVELESKEKFAVSVNTRNYLRLKVNGEDKLQAPDFHPDPLDLQPQSVKSTRLGFSIAQTDTDLILQVGDIDGSKELIPLEF